MARKLKFEYRNIDKYKYQLMEDYHIDYDDCFTLLACQPFENIDTEWIKFSIAGGLTVKKYYAWDGPSGPSVDTDTFMRGSLIHDALYQLMREGHLPNNDELSYRIASDYVLHEICRKDGMYKFRAWYVLKTLKWFGGPAARYKG